MPPRKRRQSNQGDENTNDRQLGSTTANHETDRTVNRGQQKGVEGNSVLPERRLTARQQSKQDALLESVATTPSMPVTPTADSSKRSSGRHTSEPTRFSTRIVKRPRRDLSPTESPAKKGKKAAVPEPTSTPETKAKRHWELWSCEDKDSFFEGLCEHGKDFDSIHNLIVSKCKRRGGSQPITVKNKEQVRHFYYRTWHKISKLIQPVEDMKKDIQELYGLISFGVLRKKMRGGINPNDKNWQKLNELVHFGATTIKIKGKKLRIKVPVCPALKKLNNIEEPKRDPGPKIPEKIRVEFRPKTNNAWSHVQEQAQNPRLRMTVNPDRCLSSLVRFLEQKWRPHRLKLKQNLNDDGQNEMLLKEFRVYPHSSSTLQRVNLDAVDDPVLHFCLKSHRDAIQTSPSVNKSKKAKPKSTTPVPESSETKESVINDSMPTSNKPCATDTFCGDDPPEQITKTDTNKEHTTEDSSTLCAINDMSPATNTNKPDSCKEDLASDTNKSEFLEKVSADKIATVKVISAGNSRKSPDAEETSDSNKKLCSNKEPECDKDSCACVKESSSAGRQDIPFGCDHNILKDNYKSGSIKDQDHYDAIRRICEEPEKSGTNIESSKDDPCKDLISNPSELLYSKSWQNMCSLKPTCSKCSSNDAIPVPCDNIKTSVPSELIEQTSLFNAISEVPVKESVAKTSIINTRTYLTPDLSALVDGENAMFPDTPLDACSKRTEIGTVAADSQGEKNSTQTDTEIALEEQESSPKLMFSPTNEDCLTRDSVESSQSEIERFCRDIMDRGWNVAEAENVKLAELYLMFGKNDELRFEYDWCGSPVSELQEKLLFLNNMLRRLGNLATVELTDFSKTPAAGSQCHMCGSVLGGKQAKGKEKAVMKSPPGKPRANKSCRDMSTQTNESTVLHKKGPANLGHASTLSASPDGVFRVPAASPVVNQKSITTLIDRELVHHLNPGINKQLMRPRKLKSVSRKPVIQRTILPKSQVPGQMVTFYPVVANAPGPPVTGTAACGVGQTIVGHPMGIQTQSGTRTPGSGQTIVGHPLGIQTQTVPISMVPSVGSSQQIQATTVRYVGSVGSPTVSSTSISGVELSLSPGDGDGDQTLMRIPESQIGSMSQEALRAAGMTTVPLSTITSTPGTNTLTVKGSISPPNLSSLLDISFSSIQPGAENDKFMDLSITDNSFTGLLEEAKPLSVDPGLTTPPIRNQSEQQISSLHSPPVRSLFKMNSPTPDQQWLNGEVPDLSLTSFLESPSKPALSSNGAQAATTYNTQPLTLFGDCSRDSQSNRIDVDSTLQCMMNESSMDYVRKFADLAEQIAQGDPAPPHSKPDILNNQNNHTVKEIT